MRALQASRAMSWPGLDRKDEQCTRISSVIKQCAEALGLVKEGELHDCMELFPS
jgi:hypothetical protein